MADRQKRGQRDVPDIGTTVKEEDCDGLMVTMGVCDGGEVSGALTVLCQPQHHRITVRVTYDPAALTLRHSPENPPSKKTHP